jgi:tetratricopeptide (TPR) repeat protein
VIRHNRRLFGFALAATLALVPLGYDWHSLAASAQDKQPTHQGSSRNGATTTSSENGSTADKLDSNSSTPKSEASNNSSTAKTEGSNTSTAKSDSNSNGAQSADAPDSDTGATATSAEETTDTTTSQTEESQTSTSGDDEQPPAADDFSGVPQNQKGTDALEHYDLAHFYFSKWQLNMASVEYEVAIMYAPKMKIAHRDFCLVSLLNGHPLKAFAEAMVVVGLGDPIPLNEAEKNELTQRASKTHYRRALVCARENDWDVAITELQWALEYTPDKPSVVRSLAFCYASKGDFSKAEQEYNKNFALEPDDAFSHADFSTLLEEHGQSDRAAGQLSRAIKIAPRVAALHVDMGWLDEGKNDLPAAQQEFEQAIKLCPKQPGLWLQLGKVLERAGKPEEAKNAYNKVLALDSTEDEAKQRLDALNRDSKPQAKDQQKQQAKDPPQQAKDQS